MSRQYAIEHREYSIGRQRGIHIRDYRHTPAGKLPELPWNQQRWSDNGAAIAAWAGIAGTKKRLPAVAGRRRFRSIRLRAFRASTGGRPFALPFVGQWSAFVPKGRLALADAPYLA